MFGDWGVAGAGAVVPGFDVVVVVFGVGPGVVVEGVSAMRSSFTTEMRAISRSVTIKP